MPIVTDYTAILSGNYWNGIEVPSLGSGGGYPIIVTFSFPTTLPAYDSASDTGLTPEALSSFSGFTAAEQAQALAALNEWASASGIVFLQVAPGEGDINFGNVDFTTTPYNGYGGIGFYPFGYWNNESYPYFVQDLTVSGDVFMNSSLQNPDGTVVYGTLLHEIGHAIGLKHPTEVVVDTAAEPDVTHDQVLASDDPTLTIMATVGDSGGGDQHLKQLDKDAAAFLYGPAGTGGVVTTSGSSSNSISTWTWNAATQTLTQIATGTNEVIHGTSVNDVILGSGGNDTILGLAGNDSVNGDSGNDVLFAGDDATTLIGGLGNDTLYGGAGNDSLDGGGDNDVLFAGGGNSTLTGGQGSDTLWGGAGQDILDGGDGDDSITGGSGNAVIIGSNGNDTLFAGTGTATLIGGANDDYIVGGDGADFLSGDDGDDVLFAGTGNTTLSGGIGNDYIVGGAGVDSLSGGVGRDSLFGGDNGSTLDGGADDDYIVGGAGDDTVLGGGGVDTMWGQGGNDIFVFTSVADAPPGAFLTTIGDFGDGADKMDMSAITDSQGQPLHFSSSGAFSGTPGEVIAVQSDNTTVEVDLNGDKTPDMEIFLYGAPALTNNDFIFTPLCFLAGTRIATPDGERTVETLSPGDLVRTASGIDRPIVWIGHGRQRANPGRRDAATPVLILRGALADHVPYYDLRVTKAHALFLDRMLVPVEFLVNHRSIRWDDHARDIDLYHIELESHDVLLANGAPAESYRDDRNRWLFQNANSGWGLPPQEPFAPVVTDGPAIDALWRRFLDRSGARPGWQLTDEPDLHLAVDGRRFDPTDRYGSAYRFRLPATDRPVHLRSRAAAPQELGTARDPRILGVGVAQVTVWHGNDGRAATSGDASLTEGFHDHEPGSVCQWTDGDALLPPSLFAGGHGMLEVVVRLAGRTFYPVLSEAQRAAA